MDTYHRSRRRNQGGPHLHQPGRRPWFTKIVSLGAWLLLAGLLVPLFRGVDRDQVARLLEGVKATRREPPPPAPRPAPPAATPPSEAARIPPPPEVSEPSPAPESVPISEPQTDTGAGEQQELPPEDIQAKPAPPASPASPKLKKSVKECMGTDKVINARVLKCMEGGEETAGSAPAE